MIKYIKKLVIRLVKGEYKTFSRFQFQTDNIEFLIYSRLFF